MHLLMKATEKLNEIEPAVEEYKMHLVANFDLLRESEINYLI